MLRKMSRATPKLVEKKHIKYFQLVLQMVPQGVPDASRATLAYFALSGLDLLNALDHLSQQQKKDAINWFYRLQVKGAGKRSGFESSSMIPKDVITKYHCGHLAMTYTSLAGLLILEDDLSDVDRDSIIKAVEACQNSDGSFTAMITGYESDMRFLYCACWISAVLDDWSGVDKEKAVDYIVKSFSYDGGFGQGPGLESHGGSSFCAVASLYLMDELDNALTKNQLDKLKRWCLMRQVDGFHGRPGKPSDSCYSFWIGATLNLLGISKLSNWEENRAFLLDTQNTIMGGFGKYADEQPDPLHAYFGICSLSLIEEPSLQEMHPALNISQRAYAHLQKIQNQWRGIF
ncbi:geranylgeranyl transferase type-1 subunit beta [Copidosoma floridanum]|uniref:geranylgeranyl transferase type-1 subunit beta n=1 Tax=Copidosoma floridanum TaxID=29053 RepID=UPI0006C9D1B6|nr:geranylgeranyl transferase type-1 subunit beta [Copidosoma floridanum]XP_014215363.1 geranylgeranyl transferase type-1 subunit beta [Copidosoma floridanum]XP_014215364.1 geranylgeranyl transferase type-1 subunit beta [Copidosoma floridanum]XP_014215365.1 geranylgeranyl transferase type-1 subunit beta [Copidosoma floridanum]